MSEIWGILLAAGESKRMGRQKLLLPFQGKSIIEKSVENIIRSKVDHIVVVLGSHYEEIFDQIRHLPVRFCFNEDFKRGMLSSVKCGIRTLPESCDAVLVFPGDQPMISPDVIDQVIEAYRNSDKEIVIPTFENRRGHPVLIGRKYFDEVLRLDESLRFLVSLFPESFLEVKTNGYGILRDIDTPEEYFMATHHGLLTTETRRTRRDTEI